jgi:hypothetical protein
MNFKQMSIFIWFMIIGGVVIAEEGELTGSYEIGGPNEGGGASYGNDHFHIYLEGESARALYHLLHVEPIDPKESPCGVLDDGGFEKHLHNIQCIKYPYGIYKCYFAIDVKNGTLEFSGPTC